MRTSIRVGCLSSSERLAALLCTAAMYPADARALGRQEVDLIAVPSATGFSPMWSHALAMAAASSGAYVVSCNQTGNAFAGGSSAFTPDGEPIRPVDRAGPFTLFEIDLSILPAARLRYPHYRFRRAEIPADLSA